MAVANLEIPRRRGTHAATEPGSTEATGRLTRWVRRDPVRAVAVLLIVAQLAWRLDTALRGYLAVDDYVLVARAAEFALTGQYLGYIFNDHLMPGGLLVTWFVNKAFGLTYWPYAVLLVVGQAAVDIAFFRLLRRVIPASWGQLVPLCVLLFTPLTLEVTSMWTTGVMLLPMQLAMVLALGAQFEYVRTRRLRHVATLVLAVAFGLAFFEKSLLIVALVVLATAGLCVAGGPIRTIWRTLVQFWPSWTALLILSAGYLAIYQSRAGSSVRSPATVGEAFGFARQLVGATLIPGLAGDPQSWLDVGDATPLVISTEVSRWLIWAAFLAVVVLTSRLRTVAGRAWLVLSGYVILIVLLLSMTRLGAPFSVLAGYAPRYVSDATIVAAFCLAVAMLGLREEYAAVHPPRRPLNLPVPLRDPSAVAVGLVVLVSLTVVCGVRTATSAARFSDEWAGKQGRDYLSTVRAEVLTMRPGTVFLERPVPEAVLHPLFFPYTQQSHFFNQISPRPVFVTEAEHPFIFDDTGHIRPAAVEGISLRPSSDQVCGYSIAGGKATRLPLDRAVFDWTWTIRFGYLSSGESDAIVRIGTASHKLRLHYGLNEIFIVLHGAGDAVEVEVTDPAVHVCTKDLVVGNPVPKP